MMGYERECWCTLTQVQWKDQFGILLEYSSRWQEKKKSRFEKRCFSLICVLAIRSTGFPKSWNINTQFVESACTTIHMWKSHSQQLNLCKIGLASRIDFALIASICRRKREKKRRKNVIRIKIDWNLLLEWKRETSKTYAPQPYSVNIEKERPRERELKASHTLQEDLWNILCSFLFEEEKNCWRMKICRE